MASTPQVPVAFTPDQLTRLRHRSTESGRSIAALVREAVDCYLHPETGNPATTLWAVLREPANWLEFKRIAAEMEKLTTPPVEPAAPRPTYRYQRAEGVAPRTPPPAEEQPPF